jgi:hypothetical protein
MIGFFSITCYAVTEINQDYFCYQFHEHRACILSQATYPHQRTSEQMNYLPGEHQSILLLFPLIGLMATSLIDWLTDWQTNTDFYLSGQDITCSILNKIYFTVFTRSRVRFISVVLMSIQITSLSRIPSSGMWRRPVWYKFTDVWEEHNLTDSIVCVKK